MSLSLFHLLNLIQEEKQCQTSSAGISFKPKPRRTPTAASVLPMLSSTCEKASKGK